MSRSNAWVLTAAFAASLGGGFVVGRQWPAKHISSERTAEPATAPVAGSKAGLSPANPAAPQPAFNLAEFEKRLRELSASWAQQEFLEFNGLACSVPIANARAALDKAREVLSRQQWEMFRTVLVSRWAETDAHGVLAYGAGLPDRDDRRLVVSAALTAWARQDANSAFNWLDKLPPGADRQTYFIAAFEGLAAASPDQALLRLKDVPAGERDSMRGEIVTAMAERDPKAAIDFVIGEAKERGRSASRSGVAMVLQTWFNNDASAATAWLASQPEEFRRASDIVDSIRSFGSENPLEGLRAAALLPPGRTRDSVLKPTLAAWAEEDLEALQAWVASRSDPAEKAMGEVAYAKGLAASDPAAAAALLQDKRSLENNGDSPFAEVFGEYAQRDPEAAAKKAQSLSDAGARNEALNAALTAWANSDPAAAEKFALALPSGSARNMMAAQISSTWAEADPKAYLDWLKKLPPEAAAPLLGVNSAAILSGSSPGLIADYMATLSREAPSAVQAVEDRSIGMAWAESDLNAALAWAKELPEGKAHDAAIAGICATWARSDPEAAAEFAKTLPATDARARVLNGVLKGWSSTDPNAAAQFALTVPADELNSGSVGLISNLLMQQDDFRTAAQFAAALPEGILRNSTLGNIARMWSGNDPAAAAEWLASALPEGQDRASAIGNLMQNWSSRSPEDAGKYILTLSGSDLSTAANSFVSSLASSDPDYAVEWIGKLPEGPERSEAEGSLVSGWAAQDPDAAAAWLATAGSGDNRDELATQFAQAAATEDPKLAWKWAISIGDPAKQTAALQAVAEQWLQSDPKAGRAAIQSSGLPSEVISGLLNQGK